MLNKKGWVIFSCSLLGATALIVAITLVLVERERRDIEYHLGVLGYSTVNIGVAISEASSSGPWWYREQTCGNLARDLHSAIRKRSPNDGLSSAAKLRDIIALERLVDCKKQTSLESIGEGYRDVKRLAALDTIRAINDVWMEWNGLQENYDRLRGDVARGELEKDEETETNIARLFDPWPFIVHAGLMILISAAALYFGLRFKGRYSADV